MCRNSAYIFMHVIAQVLNIWLWALSQPPQGIVQWQPWVSQIQKEQKAFATCLYPSASCKGRLYWILFCWDYYGKGRGLGTYPKVFIYCLTVPEATCLEVWAGPCHDSFFAFWLQVTVIDATSLSTECLPVHPLYGCQFLLFVRTRPHRLQVKASCSSEQDDSSPP